MMRIDERRFPKLSQDLFYKNVANKISTPEIVIQLNHTEMWYSFFKALHMLLIQLAWQPFGNHWNR